MALTFNSGMTLINNADSVTNWSAVRISGSGQGATAVLNSSFVQGTGSISAKAIGNNWDSALVFDAYAGNGNATFNLSTAGNEVVAIWSRNEAASKILNFNAEGYYIIISSSADSGATVPSVYSKWTVAGADTYAGGWVLFMIDTRKTPTSTVGGGANLAAVRRIGIGTKNISSVGTILTDVMFADALYYGRPLYRVVGDGSTVADWNAFRDHSASQANGLIEDKGGVLLSSCGFQIGNNTQSATTTFSDSTGRAVSFLRKTYWQGSEQDALNYADYYQLLGAGASGFKTSVTLGSVVGAGDFRQGVLGGSLRTGNTTAVTWKVDFKTNIAGLSAVNLYGLAISGAKGGILLENNSGATLASAISCQFVNSGGIDVGTVGGGATVLNSTVVDPTGTTNNYGLLFTPAPSGGTLTHNCKNINFITSGSPATQYMVTFAHSSDYSVNFVGLKFYGNYASGTLWHGLNSGTNADITIFPTDSDPIQTEFSNTAGGTVQVIAGLVTLTVTSNVSLSGAEVRIYDEDNSPAGSFGTELAGTESNPSSTFEYTGSSGNLIRLQIIKAGYEEFSQQLAMSSVNFTFNAILSLDENI